MDFGAAAAFVRPEILALGSEKVRAFMAAEPKLAPYRPYLEDLLRYEPHTLSAGVERISAMTGRLSGAGPTIRGVLNDAEMPWPTITLSNGDKVRLDAAALFGATSTDLDLGATAGLTWTFRAFSMP